MDGLNTRAVANIIANTLNLVDRRLVDHGKRVAGMVLRVVQTQGGISLEERRDIWLLSLIHDIGAYKTDEIDRITHFETVKVWDHSIYGYLFIKLLTPLERLAPAVFFHHADCRELRRLAPAYHDLAQILHIADRVDVLSMAHGRLGLDMFRSYFHPMRGIKFHADILERCEQALFSAGGPQDNALADIAGLGFSRDVAGKYLYMMALCIDFRSPQTVTHTVGVMRVALRLAELAGMSGEERRRIGLGSLLHDLGKQGIPLDILEAPGSLTPEQMDIMRTHVNLSEEILQGNVDETVLRIAVRHHEKLTGNGYHRGIGEAELTPAERLVAVADVMGALMGRRSYKEPFPRERVLAILSSMAAARALDAGIVGLAQEHYHDIEEDIGRTTLEAETMYLHITREMARYMALVRDEDAEWIL